LADEFDDSFHEDVFLKVSKSSSQSFFLSSERFNAIPGQILGELFDFAIYINQEPFQGNLIFVSCLSQIIFG
jgi:hypothetical protein